MPWHYRVMRKTNPHPLDEDEKYYYQIHEYHYDGHGDIGELGSPGWTDAITPYGFSSQELIRKLELMLKDAKKHCVLDYITGDAVESD